MSTIVIPSNTDSSTKIPEIKNERLPMSWNGIGSNDKSRIKCPNPGDSDCICSVCIQDKQYLVWELEV